MAKTEIRKGETIQTLLDSLNYILDSEVYSLTDGGSILGKNIRIDAQESIDLAALAGYKPTCLK